MAHPSVETRIRASDHLFYPAHHLPRLEAAIRRLHGLARALSCTLHPALAHPLICSLLFACSPDVAGSLDICGLLSRGDTALPLDNAERSSLMREHCLGLSWAAALHLCRWGTR